MRIVIAGSQQPELNYALAEWLRAKLRHALPFRPPYSTMGIFNGETLIAVLIFENYVPEHGTIEVGGAAVNRIWLSSQVINEMADFCFRQLGCQMAIFRTSQKLTDLHRLMKRAGFSLTVLPRGRGPDEDEYIFTMTNDGWDQNLLNRKRMPHGRKSSIASRS